MAKKQQAKRPALYFKRAAENEYAQGQLRDAAAALGKAYQRVAKGRGQAVEDKQLYSHLREAATSIRNASGALKRRKPAPERKRWRGKLMTIAAVGGGAALLLRRSRAEKDSAGSVSVSSSGEESATSGEHSSLAAEAPAESPVGE